MHFDGSDHQYVVGLDKRTGKTVWRTERSIDFQDLGPDGKPQADGDFRKAFSTPHIVMSGGEPVMISIGSKATYGYDPRTGKERWRLEERGAHSGSTRPVPGHGLIFYPTGFPTGQLFAIRLPANGGDAAPEVVWKVTRGVPSKPSVQLVRRSDLHGQRRRHPELRRRANGRRRCGPRVSRAPIPRRRWRRRAASTSSSEDGKTTVIDAGRAFKILGRESARRRHHGVAGAGRERADPADANATSTGLKRAPRRSYNLQSFTSLAVHWSTVVDPHKHLAILVGGGPAPGHQQRHRRSDHPGPPRRIGRDRHPRRLRVDHAGRHRPRDAADDRERQPDSLPRRLVSGHLARQSDQRARPSSTRRSSRCCG